MNFKKIGKVLTNKSLGPGPRLMKVEFTGPQSQKGWETLAYIQTRRIEYQHLEKDVYEFLWLYVGITDVPQGTFAEVMDWCDMKSNLFCFVWWWLFAANFGRIKLAKLSLPRLPHIEFIFCWKAQGNRYTD